MNAYTDTLNEWYENAERISRTNMPNDGDTIMYPRAGGAYTIEPATYGWVESIVHPDDDVRILHRAPKPEPAWHDAVAVVASTSDFGIRRVFVKDVDGIWNDALSGRGSFEGNLLDVTPLIEQEVTGEMVLAALQERSKVFGHEPAERIDNYAAEVVEYTRAGLHAALGLDPA